MVGRRLARRTVADFLAQRVRCATLGARGVKGEADCAISLPPTLRKKPRRMGHPLHSWCEPKAGPPVRYLIRQGGDKFCKMTTHAYKGHSHDERVSRLVHDPLHSSVCCRWTVF